ncbi:MAG: hypothetical protein KIT11_09805 [Fimbriimonadaceae bacterium]|nr:hypothetical protein [Fimbriimonadaceae bacterium]QYK55618.1 MAG: hypothetical protein KF733_11475 [Fimbriimonadaceae bacterium]
MTSARGRSDLPALEPGAVALMRHFEGDFADRYITELLVGRIRRTLGWSVPDKSNLAELLTDPYKALAAFYGHYAFSRRGKERDLVGGLAIGALNRLAEQTGFEEALQMPDGSKLWEAFCKVCEERGKNPTEAQNRGPIQGMLELVQEIHRLDPSLSVSTWVARDVEKTGLVEPQYLRMVDIRGLGPKGTSTFLRDMVWLYDVEEKANPAERIFVQPIDRWQRQIVKHVVPAEDQGARADWVIAGKLAKYTRRAGVSGVRFNMGVTFFGQRIVHKPEDFEGAVRTLLVGLQ